LHILLRFFPAPLFALGRQQFQRQQRRYRTHARPPQKFPSLHIHLSGCHAQRATPPAIVRKSTAFSKAWKPGSALFQSLDNFGDHPPKAGKFRRGFFQGLEKTLCVPRPGRYAAARIGDGATRHATKTVGD
jgi:hypothetical protein